jgi:hypothetical protein
LIENSSNFLTLIFKKQVYQGYSNERKGTKNYGLGIRMINWQTGQNSIFTTVGGMEIHPYITLRKEGVTIIALSNKFTRKTYDVRN